MRVRPGTGATSERDFLTSSAMWDFFSSWCPFLLGAGLATLRLLVASLLIVADQVKLLRVLAVVWCVLWLRAKSGRMRTLQPTEPCCPATAHHFDCKPLESPGSVSGILRENHIPPYFCVAEAPDLSFLLVATRTPIHTWQIKEQPCSRSGTWHHHECLLIMLSPHHCSVLKKIHACVAVWPLSCSSRFPCAFRQE